MLIEKGWLTEMWREREWTSTIEWVVVVVSRREAVPREQPVEDGDAGQEAAAAHGERHGHGRRRRRPPHRSRYVRRAR